MQLHPVFIYNTDRDGILTITAQELDCERSFKSQELVGGTTIAPQSFINKDLKFKTVRYTLDPKQLFESEAYIVKERGHEDFESKVTRQNIDTGNANDDSSDGASFVKVDLKLMNKRILKIFNSKSIKQLVVYEDGHI